MFEGISIEEFYLLYKVGEVAHALCVAPIIVGILALVVVLAVVLSSFGYYDDGDKKTMKFFTIVAIVCFFISTPLLLAANGAPTFGEVKAFVALKVGEKAANSETAQRLIDVAISKLEEKENK